MLTAFPPQCKGNQPAHPFAPPTSSTLTPVAPSPTSLSALRVYLDFRWYFYQKTKNYRVLFGGIKAGLRTGARLGGWTAAFVGLEEAVEGGVRAALPARYEGWKTRWASGLASGLAVAGASGWLCKSHRKEGEACVCGGVGSCRPGRVDETCAARHHSCAGCRCFDMLT